MSLTLDVTLPKEAAVDPRLRRALTDPRALNQAAADGALIPVQANFRRKAQTNRNRFGAPNRFWNRMLSGTKTVADAQRGVIRMPREVALRFHGGTVRPKRAKNLAIAANRDAYNKSPRQFNDLRLAILGGTKALVQEVNSSRTKRRQRSDATPSNAPSFRVMFWLVPMATIKADHTVLPPREELVQGSINGVNTYVRTLTGRASRS